jgi:hypothetical protein
VRATFPARAWLASAIDISANRLGDLVTQERATSATQ